MRESPTCLKKTLYYPPVYRVCVHHSIATKICLYMYSSSGSFDKENIINLVFKMPFIFLSGFKKKVLNNILVDTLFLSRVYDPDSVLSPVHVHQLPYPWHIFCIFKKIYVKLNKLTPSYKCNMFLCCWTNMASLQCWFHHSAIWLIRKFCMIGMLELWIEHMIYKIKPLNIYEINNMLMYHNYYYVVLCLRFVLY